MSTTLEIMVCDMTEHRLDVNDQPEFLGDGSQTIVLRGKCEVCGFDIYISYLGMNIVYEIKYGDKVLFLLEHN